MNDEDDRIIDFLRAGPPEEDSYVPRSLGAPAPVAKLVVGPVSRLPAGAPARTWARMVAIGIAGIVIAGGLFVTIGLGARHPGASPSHTDFTARSESPSASEANGWPVTLAAAFSGGQMALDPDGTMYVLGQTGNAWAIDAIGPTGQELPGWPAATPGAAVPSLLAAPGQGVLALSGAALAWIDRTGSLRSGWPIRLDPDATGPWFSPGGDVLVSVPVGQGDVMVQAYDSSGRRQPGWSAVLSGSRADDVAFGVDGTAYVATRDGSLSRIYRLDSNGAISPGWPITGWPSFSTSPLGGVAVWSYTGPGGAAVDTTVARTAVALMGADGKPLPGWPISVDGPASAPAVGQDGMVYLSLGDGRSASEGSVVAYDATGQVEPGWPVALEGMGLSMVTTVHEPAVTVAPVLRADRVVELQVSTTVGDEIVALEPSGSPAPGFPLALGNGVGFGTFGDAAPRPPPTPLLVTSTGVTLALEFDGTVYRVAAAAAGGQSLSGWPQAMRAQDIPLAWGLADQSALEVETIDPYVQPEIGRLYGFAITP